MSDELFSSLYWGMIYYCGGIQLLFFLSLVLSPIGGALAARKARSAGMDDREDYAFHAIVYFALFVIPWFLFMANLFRKPASDGVMRAVLTVVYVVWLTGPFANVMMEFFLGVPISSVGWILLARPYATVLSLLMLIGMVLSLKDFIVWDTPHRRRPDGLLELRYLRPFLYLLISALLTYPYAVVILVDGLSNYFSTGRW